MDSTEKFEFFIFCFFLSLTIFVFVYLNFWMNKKMKE